jgi:hypothetical protein
LKSAARHWWYQRNFYILKEYDAVEFKASITKNTYYEIM